MRLASLRQHYIRPSLLHVTLRNNKNQPESSTLHLNILKILSFMLYTITVPGMKSLFIVLPSCNKGLPVCHDILMFMLIKIHTIMHGTITPVEPLQPAMCSVVWNHGAWDSGVWEYLLHDWASNDLNNITHHDIVAIGMGQQLCLQGLSDILIIKHIPLRLAIMVHREHLSPGKHEDPLSQFWAHFTPCPSTFAKITDASIQLWLSFGSR